ncbi:zinc finger protein 33A-like isoform X1 [Mastacembelus armatus]|uniref:Zinc finger protein 429-like n=1 Tax=Mastacembelus armatus TaxID=205130 RepID=A0A7N8WRB6_9TELE|nr:zinc finger protein 33A-like isoform X1 [Mastacembelus armatus]
MCSVLGCGSWSRGVQRFKVPEDPEKRLEWVQFLFEVNGQRLKESSWTDITICSEHFAEDCFEHLTPAGTVQVKPDAVPSLCPKSEPEEPLEIPKHEEPVETTEVASQCDDLETNAVTSGYFHMQQTVMNTDLSKEKAALLQMKGKYIVNESCLLQLFCHKCPSCGSKIQIEKITCGLLITLNQQCLQCEYRNQWKSQISASVPTADDQHLTGGTEETPGTQKKLPTGDKPSSTVFSEILTFSDEESNPSAKREEADEVGVSSDREGNPTEDISLVEEPTKESEEGSEYEDEEEEEDFDSPSGLKINELCTECGSFFNIIKPHVCEHKIKPYSCNICGKRCVTEISLKTHSKIHDETYEHPCKYCHVTFKRRVDKIKHEQLHQDSKDPYKCPDCPKTFATNIERKIHLTNHRTPNVFICGVCGIEFKDVHHLRRHSVVHTGLKPYKCSVCQRAFNQPSHLKSHMRLHTGERPYKCQQCDKCFNHNVSLKSHVQRYHTSSSGRERQEDKTDQTASDTSDAEDNGKKKGYDSESDNIEEQDTEEEAQRERTALPKRRKRYTGGPRGRPNRNAKNLGQVGQKGDKKTVKTKVQKIKKSSEEDEQSDCGIPFDSAEEEEEEEEKEMEKESTQASKRRSKNDRDSVYDSQEEIKKKRYSSQFSGKGSGMCRGRPTKNVVT